jgi:hypothetical protein
MWKKVTPVIRINILSYIWTFANEVNISTEMLMRQPKNMNVQKAGTKRVPKISLASKKTEIKFFRPFRRLFARSTVTSGNSYVFQCSSEAN